MDKSTVREYSDFTLLIPDNEQKTFRVTRHAKLITLNGKLHYAGPEGEAAQASKSELRRSLDQANQQVTWVEKKGEGRFILPPFANCHTHLAMSLFRGSPVNLNLHDWLYEWIFPKEAKLDAEAVRRGTALSILELMKSGCAAMADMYYMEDGTSAAALEAGTRLVLTIDAKSESEKGKTELDRQSVEVFAKEWRDHQRIKPSLLVHSLYLYPEELYPALGEVAHATEIPIQIHVAETRAEIKDLADRYKASPAELMLRWNLLTPGSILAHNLYLTEEDINLLKPLDISFVTNPSSNCKLGSGIADTENLRKHGLKVVLGTDGAGSNDTLDMFRELRLAGFLAKALHEDPLAGAADSWLYWATTGGYEAMEFSQGYWQVGESIDYMIYNPHRVETEPFGEHMDPLALLTYSGTPRGVEALVVDGKDLIKDYEVQTLDEERVIYEARQAVDILQF